jgi:hypothetical protein
MRAVDTHAKEIVAEQENLLIKEKRSVNEKSSRDPNLTLAA